MQMQVDPTKCLTRQDANYFVLIYIYIKSSNAVAMVMNCIDAIYLADGREVWILGFYIVY